MGRSQALYWKIRPWLTPGLQNSHITYARTLQSAVGGADAWLDVGCGHAFVPDWTPFDITSAPSRPRRIIGIDPDANALRAHAGLQGGLVGSGEALPFADGTFDLVTANMVLEHVERPERLFREAFRVLRPGGMFLSHTPNASGYTTTLTRLGPPALRVRLAGVLQSRDAEDVYPTYYRANTTSVMTALAGQSGFDTVRIDYVESSPLFANFLPLLLPEMVFIRMMRLLRLDTLRPCLLATLRKPEAGAARRAMYTESRAV